MTGLEVEYLTRAAEEAAACSHDMTVLEPSTEYESIGLRNVEGLAVELLGLNKEVIGDACGDGMAGKHVPHDLLLISAPREVSVSTNDSLEGLGVVT